MSAMNLEKKSITGYLQRKKLTTRGTPLTIEQIGDGMKNLVYYVKGPEEDWILKQALSRVQIKERWWLGRKRIFTEKICIEILAEILPPTVIPEVVLEDRTDFILATTPPPKDSVNWEAELASGRIDLQIAYQCGELLATVHNQTFERLEIKRFFKDTKAFEQLRIEPYYGKIVEAFPDLKKLIDAQARHLLKDQQVLVLADLRPRNIWIDNGQLYLVDFAAAHFGNPSFDLAFYAGDLCLKAMYNHIQKAAYLEAINIFWNAYFKTVEYKGAEEIEKAAVRDLGCMLLGATDGRQQVDYFEDGVRDLCRRIAQSLLFTELDKIEDITEFVNRTLIDG
jgi:5-methylthioribose kinase